jgi:hypothetical protein
MLVLTDCVRDIITTTPSIRIYQWTTSTENQNIGIMNWNKNYWSGCIGGIEFILSLSI